MKSIFVLVIGTFLQRILNCTSYDLLHKIVLVAANVDTIGGVFCVEARQKTFLFTRLNNELSNLVSRV